MGSLMKVVGADCVCPGSRLLEGRQAGIRTMAQTQLVSGVVIALAAASVAWAEPAPAPVTSPAPLVDAERAFAADVRTRGFKRGFLAFVAPDGVIFGPQAVNARTDLTNGPDEPEAPLDINWWPNWAGIAVSGDLGFTTGPASFPLQYVTVWQKQADGRWLWIYDGGPGLSAKPAHADGDPVAFLAPATAAAGSAAAALNEVGQLETRIAAAAGTDAAAALSPYLSEDSRLLGSGVLAQAGGAAQRHELDWRPRRQTLAALGSAASSAGDLVFSYGEVRWTQAEAPRWGHYVRIWQKRRPGWTLVFDVWLPVPGAPPAPAQ